MTTEDEYPKYFYASKNYILWELFCIFWVPALFFPFGVLLFLGVIGNEHHVEGGYFFFGLGGGIALFLGGFARAQSYWFHWHHEGPIIKLDRNEVTYYEYSDKPIPHGELYKPFMFGAGLANFAGHIATFNRSRKEVIKLGYPKPLISIHGLGRLRNLGAIRAKMPFRGGVGKFEEEYYKLHPRDWTLRDAIFRWPNV